MNEPWRRAEADRVSDVTIAVIAEVEGRWAAEPMDPELQELIWEDEKRVLDAFRRKDMAAYKAVHADMRRKIREYMSEGGGR